MFLKVFIFSLLCCSLTFADELFNSKWEEVSQCEDGQRQSPIDIFTTKTQYDASKVDVKFDLERKKINESVTFENDGETVFLWSDDFGESVELEGCKKFFLRMVNYHWGGSEHEVDCTSFDGEIEFIFAKEGITNFTEALLTPGGTIGISVFLKVDEEKFDDIPEIAFLLKITPHLIRSGSTVKDTFSQGILSLGNLINSTGLYYRYSGSLTVTPCTEGMERFVFDKPLEVTSEFIQGLQKLQDINCDPMKKSVQRPTQPLNHRIVYKSKESID